MEKFKDFVNRYRFKDVVDKQQEVIEPNQVIRVERRRHIRRNLMVAVMLGAGAAIGAFFLHRHRSRTD